MLKDLETTLKIKVNNFELFKLACTHKSYFNESNEVKQHNERLEFLGDAVLELITTDYLFKNYPKLPEGELTALRSAVVKGKFLAQIAKKLEFGQYLLLSVGEDRSGGREKDYLLANMMEAVIGAIYLDQGYSAAQEFVVHELLQDIEGIIKRQEYLDSKTSLQEYTQEHMGETPRYELVSQSGPDHDKSFVMGVILKEKIIAEGIGQNKQSAEKEAARVALELLLSSEN